MGLTGFAAVFFNFWGYIIHRFFWPKNRKNRSPNPLNPIFFARKYFSDQPRTIGSTFCKYSSLISSISRFFTTDILNGTPCIFDLISTKIKYVNCFIFSKLNTHLCDCYYVIVFHLAVGNYLILRIWSTGL